MKKTNKLFSLFLIASLSLSLLAFTSCDSAPEDETTTAPTVTFTPGCPTISSFTATPANNNVALVHNSSANTNTVTYPDINFTVNYADNNYSNFTVEIYAKNKTIGQADVLIASHEFANSSYSFTYKMTGNIWNKASSFVTGSDGLSTTTESGATVSMIFYAKVTYNSQTKVSENRPVTLTTTYSAN